MMGMSGAIGPFQATAQRNSVLPHHNYKKISCEMTRYLSHALSLKTKITDINVIIYLKAFIFIRYKIDVMGIIYLSGVLFELGRCGFK
jgi:hypothetical protein